MIEEVLKDIGLSGNETKVYLALLNMGPSIIGDISSVTKVHRRNVYDAVEMLKGRGLISSTNINNKNIIEAVDPKRIIEIMDEKKANVENILPKLINIQSENKTNVKVYTGPAGRKLIFEDKLRCHETQYVLGAKDLTKSREVFTNNFHMRRIKSKIPLKMIFFNRDKKRAKEMSKMDYVDIRLIEDRYSSPITINIYGGKTAILLGSENFDPVTILIEDDKLAKDFKMYFDIMWGQGRKV